jgi:hypothetical protein
MRTANKTLDRMTRSAISRVFQCEHPWRAPRHRSALRLNQSNAVSADPKESYTEYYNRKRPLQWLKVGFACWGIHVGLTILLSLILVAVGVSDALPSILIGYMILGWIPLAIWAYPFLRRRMK